MPKEHDMEQTVTTGFIQPWVSIYNRVTNLVGITIPLLSARIPMGFTIMFTFLFAAYRWLFRVVILPSDYFGWQPDTPEIDAVSGNFTSMFHSILLITLLYPLLLHRLQLIFPSEKITEAPRAWQDGVNASLELCTGYMIYDTVWGVFARNNFNYALLSTGDWCYVGHHIATSVCMVGCRVIGAGHIFTMLFMLFGELSNPFNSTVLIMERAMREGDCCAGYWIINGYRYAQISYAIIFFLCRVIIGLPLAMYTTYDVLLTKRGRKNVPLMTGVLWMLAVWGVTIGSIPWIKESFIMVQHFMQGQKMKGYLDHIEEL